MSGIDMELLSNIPEFDSDFYLEKHRKGIGFYLCLRKNGAKVGSIYPASDSNDVELFLMLSEKVNKRVCEFRGISVDNQRQRGKRFLFPTFQSFVKWLAKCEFKATRRKNSKWVAVRIPI